ncbi:MAG TPA: peptidylprolyl isomerase [Caulobacteraceae bacterium]|nr:peptidylprolyl isomerase [Caulobacteraceae bacterium]
MAATTASRRSDRRLPVRLTACAAAVLLACAAGAAWAQAVPPLREGVAAIVNDEIISTYDLRQRTLLLIVTSGVQVTEATLPGIEREALRDLIDERLQMQEVRRIEGRTKVSLEPTPQELTQQVERLAQQNGLTGQQMVDSLAAAGVNQSALASQILAEISWQRYVGGRFGNVVKIGDDQIAAALKRAEASSAKPQYQVAEIFIDDQRAGGQAQAIAGAQQLIAQLQQGAPFAGVARQFSAAPSATAGGDAGWMVAGDMPPALETALEQMRPGQLSQPIPVSGGVYILLLRDKRAGQGASLVSLKQAAVRLAADAPAADVQAAQAKLEALKPQLTGCAQFEAQAGKVDGVVAGDLGETDISDLSPGFRDAITTLQVGQVSAPVRTNAGLHLVALCGKRAGGPNQPSRDDIENRLAEQELVMISRRELRNLRNSASIENK